MKKALSTQDVGNARSPRAWLVLFSSIFVAACTGNLGPDGEAADPPMASGVGGTITGETPSSGGNGPDIGSGGQIISATGGSGGSGEPVGTGGLATGGSGSDPVDTECTALEWLSPEGCKPLTVCDGATQFESLAPTETSDRICSPLTVCAPGETEIQAPTPTTDRVCSTPSGCTSQQWKSGDECKDLTVCNFASEYESVAPTATSDRVCTSLTNCTSNEYESVASTTTSDRVCTTLTSCTNNQYQSVAPTATSDRVCTTLTSCTNSQYQSVAPTATSDRVCTTLTSCTNSQYQSVAPTATSDRVCTTLTSCTNNQYQSVAPTATSDRVCTTLTSCTNNQYQSVAPTATSDRVCTTLTQCGDGQVEITPPTSTSDRVCGPEPGGCLPAKDVEIDDVLFNQAVGGHLVQNGQWVSPNNREVPLIHGRDALIQSTWDLGAGYSSHEVEARLTVKDSNGGEHVFTSSRVPSGPASLNSLNSGAFSFIVPGDELDDGGSFRLEYCEKNPNAPSGNGDAYRFPTNGSFAQLEPWPEVMSLKVMIVPASTTCAAAPVFDSAARTVIEDYIVSTHENPPRCDHAMRVIARELPEEARACWPDRSRPP